MEFLAQWADQPFLVIHGQISYKQQTEDAADVGNEHLALAEFIRCL